MSHWYYCQNGKQEGPVALDELRQMIATGELDASLPAWKIGESEWVRIRKHPELISSIPKPPPLPASAAIDLPLHASLFKRIQSVIRSSTTRSLR
jgi:hypothetical protein